MFLSWIKKKLDEQDKKRNEEEFNRFLKNVSEEKEIEKKEIKEATSNSDIFDNYVITVGQDVVVHNTRK